MELVTVAAVACYVVIAKLVLVSDTRFRFGLLAILNIIVIAFLFDWGANYIKFAAYVGLFVCHYLITFSSSQTRTRYFFGIAFPIAILILFKYLPDSVYEAIALEITDGSGPTAIGLVGLSYIAFRTSYLTVEVFNLGVERPSLAQYFSFAFFLPTFSIGPISRYQGFTRSLHDEGRSRWTPFPHSFERILKGTVKYFFLAPIFAQLDYNGLILDGNLHPPIDIVVAALAFYAFVYCNFSGFCDMVIGGAGLLRISVDENFNRPYLARNVQDFWNRWHITLNAFMRDLVFTNMTKVLVTRFGPKHVNFCLTVTIFTVFILIGLWHGKAWNFVIFGLLHGAAVVLAHWYGVILKKHLSPPQFRAYLSNKYVRAVAIFITFTYVCGTFFVFANDLETITSIVKVIY